MLLTLDKNICYYGQNMDRLLESVYFVYRIGLLRLYKEVINTEKLLILTTTVSSFSFLHKTYNL
jgi:hypothetical protein